MINKLEQNKKLWFLSALLSLAASIIGVFNQEIYIKVASYDVIPGMISQDLITIVISLILLWFSWKIKKKDKKVQIIAISFIAYLFYGYGIYVIEQIYNSLYLLYVAIVAVSFWTIVYNLININQDVLENIMLTKTVKYLTLAFSIFIPILFYILWIGQLLPLMRTGDRIEYMFSIFILDMVFVLPAFLITSYLMIKENVFAYIFAPILFFKAFTLLFSVGLGGFLKLLYNQTASSGENIFYVVLSIIFLFLALLSFRYLKFEEHISLSGIMSPTEKKQE